MRQLVLFLGLLLPLSLLAAEWELRKEEDGIVVHTRDVQGQSFAEYRGRCVLECELTEALAVLHDVAAFNDWMPDTENARLLQRSNCDQVYALETPAPWPVSRRDGVYRYHFERDTTLAFVRIAISALPEELPEQKGCQRVVAANGFWLLRPLEAGGLQVTYQLLVNPGGSLPAWLANTKAVSRPYEMLHHLRARVAAKAASTEETVALCDTDLHNWIVKVDSEE